MAIGKRKIIEFLPVFGGVSRQRSQSEQGNHTATKSSFPAPPCAQTLFSSTSSLNPDCALHMCFFFKCPFPGELAEEGFDSRKLVK